VLFVPCVRRETGHTHKHTTHEQHHTTHDTATHTRTHTNSERATAQRIGHPRRTPPRISSFYVCVLLCSPYINRVQEEKQVTHTNTQHVPCGGNNTCPVGVGGGGVPCGGKHIIINTRTTPHDTRHGDTHTHANTHELRTSNGATNRPS